MCAYSTLHTRTQTLWDSWITTQQLFLASEAMDVIDDRLLNVVIVPQDTKTPCMIFKSEVDNTRR